MTFVGADAIVELTEADLLGLVKLIGSGLAQGDVTITLSGENHLNEYSGDPAPWVQVKAPNGEWAIWRANGAVYGINPDNTVTDDPIIP